MVIVEGLPELTRRRAGGDPKELRVNLKFEVVRFSIQNAGAFHSN
jgi:hypothetical protein